MEMEIRRKLMSDHQAYLRKRKFCATLRVHAIDFWISVFIFAINLKIFDVLMLFSKFYFPKFSLSKMR